MTKVCNFISHLSFFIHPLRGCYRGGGAYHLPTNAPMVCWRGKRWLLVYDQRRVNRAYGRDGRNGNDGIATAQGAALQGPGMSAQDIVHYAL